MELLELMTREFAEKAVLAMMSETNSPERSTFESSSAQEVIAPAPSWVGARIMALPELGPAE